MRKVTFCLFTILLINSVVYAKRNHALLVLIGSYPEHSEWWSINAATDGEWLMPALLQQGFEVRQLRDKEATKVGIIDALKQLTRDVKLGDMAVIHFSCHGQQMKDDNGDELDGWDESLIPYDAGMVYEKGYYEGENHLRDDELNLLIIELRKKLGNSGEVLVTLDSCHSGSATRDDSKDEPVERGTLVLFTPYPNEALHPEAVLLRTKTTEDVQLETNKEWAELTVVSACKSYQINREVRVDEKSGGPLSYVLSQLWQKHLIVNTSEWIEDVIQEVRKITKQTPVVETTRSNKLETCKNGK